MPWNIKVGVAECIFKDSWIVPKSWSSTDREQCWSKGYWQLSSAKLVYIQLPRLQSQTASLNLLIELWN